MSIRRAMWALAGLVSIGLATAIWTKEFHVSLDPAKTLPISLLGDIAAFHDRIGQAPYMGHDGERPDKGAFFFEAPAAATAGPDGYTLVVESQNCDPVTLPTGRMVAIDHIGPWISGASVNAPMEPITFEQAVDLAVTVMDDMMKAGWDRFDYRPDVTPERIAEIMGNRHTLARFTVCGDPGTLASITIRDFTHSSPGHSIPPLSVGSPQPEDAPVRYILNVNIMARTFEDGVPDLIDPFEARVNARREAVTGDPNKAIPLSTWFQDPQWLP